MIFDLAMKEIQTRFSEHGQFSLHSDESINEVVRREKVPNGRGVYIIFRSDDSDHPLYIGKAGTANQDGTWRRQGIAKRLTMKQERMYRRDYFRKVIAEESVAGLTFHWYVTWNGESKILPTLAEMELMQAHFGQFGCLPKLNRSA
jgi:hypothetical protein